MRRIYLQRPFSFREYNKMIENIGQLLTNSLHFNPTVDVDHNVRDFEI